MKQVRIEGRKPGEAYGIRSMCNSINADMLGGKINQSQALAAATNMMQDWQHNFPHDEAQLRVRLV